MIAFAEATRPLSATDLAEDLTLAQSAFQAVLRDLERGGLIEQMPAGGRRKEFRRVESKVWDWILELQAEVEAETKRRPVVEISKRS